ncbi:hypothetical protein H2201_000396 [Coniosporium apollinis]|uniref:Thioredoxin domain-containing protein n=1 Tax=Coniosporium apollinis TaxID=61459 RepID=A0ABQ9P7H8_9PEZI|nr:hypothetical protein H2201_000396 [Coniosporium apollinis]
MILLKQLPRRIALPTLHVTRPFSHTPVLSAKNRIYTSIRTPDELHTLNLASTHSSRPLLTLWTASWCPSCGEVAPILRELVEEEGVGEQEGGVGYAEVELDAMTIGDMGVRFMINSIPTLLAFSRAEPQMETRVTRLEDLKNREFLRTWIRKEASRRGEGGAGGSLFGGWFGR